MMEGFSQEMQQILLDNGPAGTGAAQGRPALSNIKAAGGEQALPYRVMLIPACWAPPVFQRGRVDL